MCEGDGRVSLRRVQRPCAPEARCRGVPPRGLPFCLRGLSCFGLVPSLWRSSDAAPRGVTRIFLCADCTSSLSLSGQVDGVLYLTSSRIRKAGFRQRALGATSPRGAPSPLLGTGPDRLSCHVTSCFLPPFFTDCLEFLLSCQLAASPCRHLPWTTGWWWHCPGPSGLRSSACV